MKVLITCNLPKEVVGTIEKKHHVQVNDEDQPMVRKRLLQSVKDKEGLLCTITDQIDGELLDKAPHLRMIANYGVGFNNIDLGAATAKGIPVSNTPGVLTDATADITLTLILATARRVVEGDKRNRKGEFQFWAPLLFLGREVSGKTLGIIGLGRIGKAVVQRARGFEMHLLYHNRHRFKLSEEKQLGVQYADLKRLLTEADFVSLHVPLTDQTHHLIGPHELERMKPSAILINASRGPVVDERALVTALKTGQIAGAGLDVYEEEPNLAPGLADLDNVTLLPHVGSATLETRTKMAQLAVENLLAGLRGEIPPNCLNCDEIPQRSKNL
ncbi:MAG: D-glycerate dehydrogenase [Desulfobacteraceae bacterium]|jgi:glyoxylate reductase